MHGKENHERELKQLRFRYRIMAFVVSSSVIDVGVLAGFAALSTISGWLAFFYGLIAFGATEGAAAILERFARETRRCLRDGDLIGRYEEFVVAFRVSRKKRRGGNRALRFDASLDGTLAVNA